MFFKKDAKQGNHHNTKSKNWTGYMLLVLLFWEVIRFGIIWNAAAAFLGIEQSYPIALYVLWLMAPVLAVMAGIFFLWIKDKEDTRILQIVLAMAKGFQAVFGIIATILLFLYAGHTSVFFQGVFFTTAGVSLADILASLFLIRYKRRKTA